MARPQASVLVAVGVALIAAVVFALTTRLGTDYQWDGEIAINALRDGDLGAFFGHQPGMGQLSLWLRWPAAEIGGGSHAVPGDLGAYRAGALVCLLFPVALSGFVARRTTISLGALVGGALVANPVTIRALGLGHPEEAMCAALCVGAVLLALDGRAGASGVVLGLALATKQWALLAVIPALLAVLPADRRRLLLIAAGVGASLTLPALIADPHAFLRGLDAPATGVFEMRPANVWSLVIGPTGEVSLGSYETASITLVPHWLRTGAHPGIVVACLALPLLLRGRMRRPADVLAVLALVFLARCALDPWNHEYYHLPFLMAVAALEVRVLERAPVFALASSAVLWVVFAQLTGIGETPLLADVVYLMWVLVAGGWLVAGLARGVRRLEAEPLAAA